MHNIKKANPTGNAVAPISNNESDFKLEKMPTAQECIDVIKTTDNPKKNLQFT